MGRRNLAVRGGDRCIRVLIRAAKMEIPDQSNVAGRYSYLSVNADGSGVPARLVPSEQEFSNATPAWSPDGKLFVYTTRSEGSGLDVWIASSGQEPDPSSLGRRGIALTLAGARALLVRLTETLPQGPERPMGPRV